MASREVTAAEKSKYGDKFQEFPIGYDGIVIVVSKPLYDAGITNLTKAQVKKIYSGEIKNWKDLGGPDAEIYVVSREQGSGTRDTFNEDIMGNRSAETPGVNTVALGSAEVKTAVAGSDKAIGYLGYSYAEGGNVGAMALDGVKPTIESIKDGSYELARKLYFYTYGDPKPGAKAFIDFVLSPEGQKIAAENGFIPLTSVSTVTPAEEKAASSPAAGKEEPSAPKAQPGFETALAVLSMAAVSYVALRRR
jgi:phosphate transport system substrate-binding protein